MAVPSLFDSKPWLASYHGVPPELPLPACSVLDAFERRAREGPDEPAIGYFDETLTVGQVNEAAERFAALLERWDIGRGDRGAPSLQNNPQFVIAQFGAWKRGAVVAPLNPMFREKELAYHLRDSGARVWVGLESLDTAETRAAIGQSAIERAVVTNERDWRGLLRDAPEARGAPRVAVQAQDLAFLVYTSGTTGDPKGAMILHGNASFNAEVYRVWMRVDARDTILGLAPLFHVTGLIASIALMAWTGAPLVLFHRFDAARALELAGRWNAPFSVAAITAYLALLNLPAGGGPRPLLAKCYSGGAPVAPAIPEQFEQRFGTYIHNIYGLTESTSPSHATPLGVRGPVDPASGALAIGLPIPNLETRILGLEDPGRDVEPGEAGELAMRGPMMFAGYWNKPEETARAVVDGFFRTGDVAMMDPQGWFYIVDRKKDLIVASGFKVWPRDVEDALYQHPAVREAAVVGVPDPYRGETVKAFVALKEGHHADAAQIVAFCRDRLAAYKIPRQVEFVDELPKTATGKFMRRALRGR